MGRDVVLRDFADRYSGARTQRRARALTVERLGVPGGEIVFLDDFEPNCAAAGEAGWTAVRFEHTAQAIAELDAVLDDRGVPPGVAASRTG